MKDAYFSIDQQLVDRLINAIDFPLDIDILKSEHFLEEQPEITSNEEIEMSQISEDIINLSYKALEYAENVDEEGKFVSEHDELLYDAAVTVVNAYLSETKEDSIIEESYNKANLFSLWGKIKKHAKKAFNWLKKQIKKVIGIDKVTLDKMIIQVESKPSILLRNPVSINNIRLNATFHVNIKYHLGPIKGGIKFMFNKVPIPRTDLDLKFNVDGLKYTVKPKLTEFKIRVRILGIKITIPLEWLVNPMFKEKEIFDASKYIPIVPWFGKTFKPTPPLGLSSYNSGLNFGIEFKIE